MFNRPMKSVHHRRQTGASLIEVLVAILLLSFGMLALGAMLSFAVQAPKLSGYRATATLLASSHIERMRANPEGFKNQEYKKSLRETEWSFNEISLEDCSYPDCTEESLATMDDTSTRRSIRTELPAGDMLVTCSQTTDCNDLYGNLWVVWQEPKIFTSDPFSSSDNCPDVVKAIYTSPSPRCLYVRFKIG